MTDDTKLVPCLMCMDQGLYTCKGHHETMTINASKLNPVPERDEVYESVKRGLEGGGSHDLGTFSDESKLVPCSLCCGEVFPEMEHGVLITGGEQFYIAQCPKCCTITSAESWNRLHGGTRIEVEGCWWFEGSGVKYCNFSHETYGELFCGDVLIPDCDTDESSAQAPDWCPLRRVNQGPTTIGIKEV